MKILERLRGLASTISIEPQAVDHAYEATLLDAESADYDDRYDMNDDETGFGLESGLPNHTIDGYRRRIPDVHENIPPESYVLSDAGKNLDAQ